MSFGIKSIKDQEVFASRILTSDRIPIVDTTEETPLKGSIALDSTDLSLYYADGTEWLKVSTEESFTFLASVIQVLPAPVSVGSMSVTLSKIDSQVSMTWTGTSVVLDAISPIELSPVLPIQFRPLYNSSNHVLPAVYTFGGNAEAGTIEIDSSPAGTVVMRPLAGSFPAGAVTIHPGSTSWIAA